MDIEIKVTVMTGPFVGMGGNLKLTLDDSRPAIEQIDKINSAISVYGTWVKTARKDIYPDPDNVLKILHVFDNTRFNVPKPNTCEQTSLF